MAEMRYREALNAALREELRRDERVLLIGEDIGVFGGAFRVTEGLLEEFGERRVRDTPISENTIVGVGVGAAMTGLRPVVELDDDQLRPAGVRPDRQPRRPHPLHVRWPGARADGRAHAPGRRPSARPDPLALPGGPVPAHSRPAVAVPATAADAKGLLKTAIRDENPVIFIEHESLYGVRGEVPEDEERLVHFGQGARGT